MDKWEQLADDATIKKTIAALKTNGIEAEVVKTPQEAKERVLQLIPEGAEVMENTSRTLDEIGATEAINSGKYKAVKKQLMTMNRDTQKQEMNRLVTVHEFAIGSVHAVTVDGSVLIASNSGSNIPNNAYGALKVIWVVGTQKIVKNFDEGIKRVYEHSLPLEDKRAQEAYGIHSFVSKLLVINRETIPGRIHLIFVKQKLGF